MTNRPLFAVLSFDYRNSLTWPDLPRLRDALGRLVAEWSAHMPQELHDLAMGTEPGSVMAALDDLLLSRLTADDAILIYIGGHGARLGDDYFVAGPAATPERLTQRNGLAASDIAQVIGQGRPSQVLLLIDTCFSGAGGARLAASVDEIISRQAKDGFSMFVMSSAHAQGLAWDGVFVEELLDVLSDPDPLLWARVDRSVAPSQVARALRARLGSAIESREHNYVEPILPNLAYRDQLTMADESARLARQHFFRAASGLSGGDGGWCFVWRGAELTTITDWIRQPDGDMFILTGPPGAGKSAILGVIALLSDKRSRDEIVERLLESPRAGTIIDVPEIAAAIHARDKTLVDTVAELARALRIQDVRSPDELLAHLASGVPPSTILVDALDEAMPEEATRIAEFLRDLADLPRVKILVGTRPDRARDESGSRLGPLLRALEPATVLDLKDDPEASRTSVAEYVRMRLLDAREQSPYVGEDKFVTAIADELARRTDGVFLYARLMTEVLLSGESLDEDGDWRAQLPGADREDLLESVVSEDLSRIPVDRRAAVRHMLMALSFTEGEGLPRYRVWPAFAAGLTGISYSEADATATVTWASWYLAESREGGQQVYRLNHEELIRHFRAASQREF
jgi:hypothetical protein